MRKMKSFLAILGYLMLVVAAVAIYFSVGNLRLLPSANSYVDEGVVEFIPYNVLPYQVKNNDVGARNRRMNPTKTIYRVHYKAVDGSGYQFSEKVVSRTIGQKIVDEKVLESRRVLSLPADNTFITVAPEYTAESYTAHLKRRYMVTIAVAGTYILLFGAYLVMRRALSNSDG